MANFHWFISWLKYRISVLGSYIFTRTKLLFAICI